MQQFQSEYPGAMPDSISVTLATATSRHEGLLLIGSNRHTLLHGPLLGQVVQRLLSPSAQIEGVDFHLNDPALADSGRTAQAFVLLLPPLGNLDNPFYSVHCRRNDRFLAARPGLRGLFPEVDFTEFDFTGHMLGTLATTCPERFIVARRILQQTWLRKMDDLLMRMPARGILLHQPGPAWLPVPASALASFGRPVVSVDCADRAEAVAAVRAALGRSVMPLSA